MYARNIISCCVAYIRLNKTFCLQRFGYNAVIRGLFLSCSLLVSVFPPRAQKADDGSDDDENEAAQRPRKRRPGKTEKKRAVNIFYYY